MINCVVWEDNVRWSYSKVNLLGLGEGFSHGTLLSILVLDRHTVSQMAFDVWLMLNVRILDAHGTTVPELLSFGRLRVVVHECHLVCFDRVDWDGLRLVC